MNQELEELITKKKSVALLKNDIVAGARTWLGTKFLHQGTFRKNNINDGGCDCLGLVIGVVSELLLISKLNVEFKDLVPIHYPRMPDSNILEAKLREHLYRIPLKLIAPGDLLLMKIAGKARHLAIVSYYDHNNLGIIHSFAKCKAVVEHALDQHWRDLVYQAYSFYPQ